MKVHVDFKRVMDRFSAEEGTSRVELTRILARRIKKKDFEYNEYDKKNGGSLFGW